MSTPQNLLNIYGLKFLRNFNTSVDLPVWKKKEFLDQVHWHQQQPGALALTQRPLYWMHFSGNISGIGIYCWYFYSRYLSTDTKNNIIVNTEVFKPNILYGKVEIIKRMKM